MHGHGRCFGTAGSVPATGPFREASDENRPCIACGFAGRTSARASRSGADPCDRQVGAVAGGSAARQPGSGGSRRYPVAAAAARSTADRVAGRSVARAGAGRGFHAGRAGSPRSRSAVTPGAERPRRWRLDGCHFHDHHHHRSADHHPDRRHRRLTFAGPIVLAAAVALSTAAAAFPQTRPVSILDVPYVLQSEELCGGAAVAMVMRYWGATGIYAESFASLVDKQAGGIKGDDLLSSLHDRGWNAVSFGGDAALVQRTLQHRQPPIALIEDRPGRFHYVVI